MNLSHTFGEGSLDPTFHGLPLNKSSVRLFPQKVTLICHQPGLQGFPRLVFERVSN
uniref:Uncharacterized protein n=1 Tax=Anguilla anguilla TaxID=7936 RepID=A0A0E9WA10_ANGAN